MAFTIPTREEIFQVFLADYQGAQPGKNVARGSDPYRLGRVVSGVVWLIVSKLLFFSKQALPDTATGWWLDRWGAVFNFPRLPAVGSTGTTALRVTGTIGAPVPVNSELGHLDGTLYKVATTGAVIGGSGYVDVDVAAESTGLATNKGIGEVLSFTSPIANVDGNATLVARLTGGTDLELDDPYRVRLLAHIGDPPEGGAIHDYVEWAKSVPGVTDAYVYAHRRGFGTIDVAVLGSGTGSARVLSSTVTDAVDAKIESLRPGNARDFVVLTTVPNTLNVKLTITIDSDRYGWDWVDNGVGYLVSAVNIGTKTLTVPSLPATVVAGKRIQILGEEARVASRAGSDITLSFENDYDGNIVSWFSNVVLGEYVRCSGDLVRPARNAILALFNALGPGRYTDGLHPNGYAKTSWTSDLRLSKLNAAVTDVDGIDDCAITTPVITTVQTDDLSTTQIKFLVPGRVEVYHP